MNENIEATHLHSHQVQMILEGLAKMPVSATEGKSLEDVKAQIQDSASKAPGLPTTPPEMNLQANAAGSDDFFAELIEMITFIREGYLGIYENLITKYSAFFKEFNEAVTSKMGGWITGANEGKDVKIDPGFRIALQALIDKYSAMPQGILFPAPNADGSITGVSREEALKWAATFGMDPSSVVQDASGKYVVMMDLSPIKAMRDSLPTGDIQWDSAKFQAWQTGFNSQESELKNQLQVFTTKYGNANSYYENFNKILSSQLSSFAEVLKAYISS
ncbi:invasin D [Pseudomonas sp. LAMO17WK12:I10]|nr:invasin D [Pseudomonas sp. LAMO17WK12:I9]SNY51911.1 invasin D [Pseudomonas sp. LAMO17WK12:I10]